MRLLIIRPTMEWKYFPCFSSGLSFESKTYFISLQIQKKIVFCKHILFKLSIEDFGVNH